MAIIVAIAADPTREVHFLPAVKRSLAGVPAGIGCCPRCLWAAGYWGLHLAFYGPGGSVDAATIEKMTHTPNREYPHGTHGGR